MPWLRLICSIHSNWSITASSHSSMPNQTLLQRKQHASKIFDFPSSYQALKVKFLGHFSSYHPTGNFHHIVNRDFETLRMWEFCNVCTWNNTKKELRVGPRIFFLGIRSHPKTVLSFQETNTLVCVIVVFNSYCCWYNQIVGNFSLMIK